MLLFIAVGNITTLVVSTLRRHQLLVTNFAVVISLSSLFIQGGVSFFLSWKQDFLAFYSLAVVDNFSVTNTYKDTEE